MRAAMPSGWSYRRHGEHPEVEYAFWSGTVAPGIAAHFHPQIQLTAVLSGGRTFQVGHRILTTPAGQCLYIPAGMPHKSLPVAHEETRCLNIYLDLDGFGVEPTVFEVLGVLQTAQDVTSALSRIIRCLGLATRPNGDGAGGRAISGLLSGREPVGIVAARNRLSREGFSRQFTRKVGIPPNGYRLVSRLNEARERLRGDVPIAELAAELGFADQSHFGRHFRRVFGVSPDAYRKSVR